MELTKPNKNMLISFSLLFIAYNVEAATTNTSCKDSSYTNYLKTACNTTTYPTICFNSLSPYTSTIKTNDLNLCTTALSLSLQAATNVSSLVTKVSKEKGLSGREIEVVKDCVEEIGDTIDELKQSLNAMGSLKVGKDVEFQIDNVKTWVSAAITDEYTCTDGFEGSKVTDGLKTKIKNSIVVVARLTSNALSLINKLKY